MTFLVTRFPAPTPGLNVAYTNLQRCLDAKTADEVQDLGPLNELPHPWIISSITDPSLRFEAWEWLDKVVDWLNTEYYWAVADLIPACWPQHPHIVNELAVIADQRRRAEIAFTSDAMEDWHRYTLPMFCDRMKNRYQNACEEHHQPAPGRTRLIKYRKSFSEREPLYIADVTALPPPQEEICSPEQTRAKFTIIDGLLVDNDTGEIL